MMTLNERLNWCLVPGTDRAQLRGVTTGADVAIQDLGSLTTVEQERGAWNLTPEVAALWRERGTEPAVRVRSLEDGGSDDVRVAVASRVNVIVTSSNRPADVVALDREMSYLEGVYGVPFGRTEICLLLDRVGASIDIESLAGASTRILTVISPSAQPDEQFRRTCLALGIRPVDVGFSQSGDAVDRHERELRAMPARH